MPKVRANSLRSLASKLPPSVVSGALFESADYIDELEKEIERLEAFIENLQVVHFAENQREKSKVERYEKALDLIIKNTVSGHVENIAKRALEGK